MFSSNDDSEGGNGGVVEGVGAVGAGGAMAGNSAEAWAAAAASTEPGAGVSAGAHAGAGIYTDVRGTYINYATAARQEPLLISVPSGVRVEAVGLVLCVQGVHDGARRDVARLKLGLHYFMNAPLYTVEHIMDRYVSSVPTAVQFLLIHPSPCHHSPLAPRLHAASVLMVSKVFESASLVSTVIMSIECKGLAKNAGGVAIAGTGVGANYLDPYITMKWRGTEIVRTPPIKNSLSPKWSKLDIVLPLESSPSGAGTGVGSKSSARANVSGIQQLSSEELEENCLKVEVWDSDLISGGALVGKLVLTFEQVRVMFTGVGGVNQGESAWLSLDAGSSGGILKGTGAQAGKILLRGFTVSAAELTPALMQAELDAASKLIDAMDGSSAGAGGGGGRPGSATEGNSEVLSANSPFFYDCEVHIAAARDVSAPESNSVPALCAVIFFNGGEVGRTGVAEPGGAPIWDSETFAIRAPGTRGDVHSLLLEDSVLMIQLWDIGDSGGRGVQG